MQQLGIVERGDHQQKIAYRVVTRARGRPGTLDQQHDGQVRPALLLVEECLQQRAWALAEHLLGNDCQACAFSQAAVQVGQVDSAQAIDAGGGEQARGIRR